MQAIVEKGLAYDVDGSVYMSIDAFKAAGFDYRKLDPHTGDTSEAEMAESEGAAGGGGEAGKRNKNDFALWKSSKPGEPAWQSPWGLGRPGWHIECSVIASDILGPNLDVSLHPPARAFLARASLALARRARCAESAETRSRARRARAASDSVLCSDARAQVHAGGVDLKFPHHDNELCQAEARFGHGQWVNHFWHSGHLHIKGLKMSKSLKNFTTIREALEHHSARQLRLMFLLQAWDKNMNYSDQTVGAAQEAERVLRGFFGSVRRARARARRARGPRGSRGGS